MTALRRVRRVALRAPSEPMVRRGAVLLEDALRTASWPLDTPGSLVVVRRLDVGAIDPDESPSALSTRIEARLRELSARVVAARAPEASHADVVRFADPLEPAVMLAEHASRTSAAPPWFLLRAVPSARPELGAMQWLRAALAAAIETTPAAPAAMVDALLARGSADALFAVLEARDGAQLLASLGLSALSAPRREQPADVSASPRSEVGETLASHGRDDAPEALGRRVLSHVSKEFREALVRRVASWGVDDARSLWLAALALLARTPSLSVSPRLVVFARALLDEAARAAPASTRSPLVPSSTQRKSLSPSQPSPIEGVETAWGGLLFFVPLFVRLGMDAFLDAHPALAEAAFPAHLLGHLARRLDVPLDDPALVAIGAPETPLPDVAITAPEALLRLAGSSPFARPNGSTSHAALALFHAALRRVVRRGARIGLRAMVERPARVWASRTHIDVALDMRRVHLGLRRIGADLDPGFVPWLGRVIHFHYRIGEEPRD